MLWKRGDMVRVTTGPYRGTVGMVRTTCVGGLLGSRHFVRFAEPVDGKVGASFLTAQLKLHPYEHAGKSEIEYARGAMS